MFSVGNVSMPPTYLSTTIPTGTQVAASSGLPELPIATTNGTTTSVFPIPTSSYGNMRSTSPHDWSTWFKPAKISHNQIWREPETTTSHPIATQDPERYCVSTTRQTCTRSYTKRDSKRESVSNRGTATQSTCWYATKNERCSIDHGQRSPQYEDSYDWSSRDLMYRHYLQSTRSPERMASRPVCRHIWSSSPRELQGTSELPALPRSSNTRWGCDNGAQQMCHQPRSVVNDWKNQDLGWRTMGSPAWPW